MRTPKNSLVLFFAGVIFSQSVFPRPPLCPIEKSRDHKVEYFEQGFRSKFCDSKISSATCDERWKNARAFLTKSLNDERIKNVATIAYMFGTIHVETGVDNYSPSTKEIIGKVNRNKDYVKEGFFGRGWVQLTHKDKYRKAKQALNIDFVSHPELAEDLDNAYEILYRGMSEGWIEVYRTSVNGAVVHETPIKLSDFISSDEVNFGLARSVINANCKKDQLGACLPPNIEYKKGLFIPPETSLDAGIEAAKAASKMEAILCQ